MHGYTRRVTGSAQTGAQGELPSRLGDFEILGLLGEGGSGLVYAARWGHRDVALKVLHPSLVATPRERERFFFEARVLAEITHPSVVKVLNVGALPDPDGRPYLAMEKLDGETLAARLARGAMGATEAIALFDQLVGAVDALHARGLVHRDLKAENVMLVEGGRFAVLLDFGIAKELDAPASTVTQDGGIRGTPAYMAPERFFGQPASPHTDIYELAVVLYAMLVGCLPWDVTNDADARLHPHRPSELGVELPGTLETELLRALSTRPESRPASAREFMERIRSASSGNGPAAMRRTADMGAAPAVEPSPAPASPPGVDPYAPTRDSGLRRPRVDEQAVTTASVEPAARGKSWPWLVVGLVVVGLIALTVVLVRSGDSGEPEPAVAAKAPNYEEAKWTQGDDQTPPTPTVEPLVRSERALTSPPPAPRGADPAPGFVDAARHHAADTQFILAVRARALLESKPIGSVLLAQRDNKGLAPLLVVARLCQIDIFHDIDWLTFGIADLEGDAFDVIISGNLDREKFDACAAKLSVDASAVGWIDDRTLLMTSRKGADKNWIEARVAGTDSFADDPGKAAMLSRVDRASTIWFAGEPGDLLANMEPGTSKPTATFGGLQIGGEVAADVWVRYASESEAKEAGKGLQKQLVDIPQDVFGEISVEAQGNELRFRAYVNSMVTEILATYLESELRKASQ